MTPTNHPAPESEREAIARTLFEANTKFNGKDDETIGSWTGLLQTIADENYAATSPDWHAELKAARDYWLTLADAILSRRGEPVATSPIGQSDVEMLTRLADSMGFGRTHDMLRRVIAACPYLASPPAPALDARTVKMITPARLEQIRTLAKNWSDIASDEEAAPTGSMLKVINELLRALRADQGK